MGKKDEESQRGLGWREWTVIASVPAVAAGVAAVLFPSFRGFIANNATAAWIQALGSIGAIGVAIYVSQKQAVLSRSLQEMQHSRDIAQRSDDRKLQSLAVANVALQIANVALQSKKNLDKAVLLAFPEDIRKSKQIVKSFTKAISISMEALGKVPIHEMPYAKISPELFSIRLFCEMFIDVFTEISAAGSEKIKAEVKGLDAITKTLESHRDRVRAYKKNLENQ